MNRRKQWNIFFAIEKNISYGSHLQETKELAHSIQQSALSRYRISFGNIIIKQLKFFALKIWIFQGMVLALLCALIFHLYNIFPFYGSGTFEWTQRISKILCLSSSIVVMSAIPILFRSTRYQMMELEQSTYFSVRGNLLAQLLFLGIGDLGMLTALALLAGKFQAAGSTIFLSLVIPYLTAATSCLMLWIRTTPRFFLNTGVILCIGSACLIYEVIGKSRIILGNASLYVWGLYAFAIIGILYSEYRKLCLHGIIEKF